jgi:GH25 family lysozyme M1 (1,4-beta-N-acetylmuramidase)
MPTICPKCGGLQPGCSVCDAPAKREKPFDRRATSRTTFISLGIVPDEWVWQVQGIDISAWNGVMDFSITKTKCQYAVVRLGYGNGWKDSRADVYRRGLIANDMPYFVYWYNRIGEDWQVHAESFVEVAAEFPGHIGYEEDFEQTSVDKTQTLSWIINYDTRLKSLVNQKTTPYSSKGFWDDKVAVNSYFADEQWIANWTDGNAPWMPRNWIWKRGCKWQWSADGNRKAKEYGMISGGDYDMDLKRYYGTVDEFNIRYNTHILPSGQVVPPPPPSVIVPLKYVVITAEALNMRSIPGGNPPIGADIGTLKNGDDIPVVEERSGWYRTEGWVSAAWTRPR